MDTGAVKNLDEIQEVDPSSQPSRLGALVLASLGGACIVFAAVALMRTPPRAKPVVTDPLGDLVARTHPAGAKLEGRRDVVGHDVTFPGILSNDQTPTTALEAVRDAKAAASNQALELPAGSPTAPPSAADRLPIFPLPAQNMLQASTAGTAPQDALSSMARHVSREEGVETASGGPGGYQLQVSSFKTPEEAATFAAALRRRGHKAYVEPAHVKGRGLWHRVRIGPFKYRHSAIIYRQDFEAKERMVTFIVDPPKTTVRVRSGDAEE